MRRNIAKIQYILLILLSIILIGSNIYAHSGRTDANGGHKDNKNKSGLGSYHYHCGGNPAHLHTNGVCPYSSSSSSSKSSTSSSSSSSKRTTTVTSSTVTVTGIQINENIESLEVGKSKILTVTITPSNATDKSVTWKSSDENIATISTAGEIIAKNPGIVDIMATSSNGKTSTIEININEVQEAKNNTITNTMSTTKSNITNNISANNKEDPNSLGILLTLALLGSGGYFVYKKYKKKE